MTVVELEVLILKTPLILNYRAQVMQLIVRLFVQLDCDVIFLLFRNRHCHGFVLPWDSIVLPCHGFVLPWDTRILVRYIRLIIELVAFQGPGCNTRPYAERAQGSPNLLITTAIFQFKSEMMSEMRRMKQDLGLASSQPGGVADKELFALRKDVDNSRMRHAEDFQEIKNDIENIRNRMSES